MVLDARQAFSVDDLIELVEKSERGLISEKKLPFEKVQRPSSLDIETWLLNDKTDQELTHPHKLLLKSFVKPVKKKRMHPPMGKKTKPAKKKRS